MGYSWDDDESVSICLAAYDAGRTPERINEKAAVKYSLELFAQLQPGNSVEVRVPPYKAVQAIEGPTHRRGTPPAIVETDARTWLHLVVGRLTWADAIASGSLFASGERSDLSEYFPLAQ